MEFSDKERLRLCHDAIMEDLDQVSSILDHFFTKGIVTNDTFDEIMNSEPKTRGNQVRELLRRLPGWGPEAYKVFFDALGKTGYEHLATTLNNAVVDSTPPETWFDRLSAEKKSRKPTQKELNDIAKGLGLGWESIGVGLGLTNTDIDRGKMQHPHSPQMQMVSMFMLWLSRNGSKATIGWLVETLMNNNIDENIYRSIAES